MFYYKIYGLNVESQLELEEAESIKKPEHIEVTISEGKMPEFVEEKKKEGYSMSHTGKKMAWLYYPDIGDFLVQEGATITFRLAGTNDLPHAKAVILGACFGDIMYQRDLLNLHGSAVVQNEKAIIISGASGSGKSTTSDKLRKMGCRLLADDTVVVNTDGAMPEAVPGYPIQKLCRDAALNFGYRLEDLVKIDENEEKYAVYLKEDFCNHPMPIAVFVLLEKYEGDKVIYEAIEGSQKVECLMKSLYVYQLYKNLGMGFNVFHKCVEMAKKVKVLRIQRPIGQDTTDEITQHILEAL